MIDGANLTDFAVTIEQKQNDDSILDNMGMPGGNQGGGMPGGQGGPPSDGSMRGGGPR